jgi:SAM-dependent methyltransferase
LDFSRAPHELLREVERILVPEGHLLILGFNPWSLWGVWRLARRYRGQPPWNGAFVSQRRLGDWLSLLGFDIVATRRLLHRAPFALPGFAKRGDLRLLPGGVYLLHARKRVSRLVPVGLSLRASERLLGAGVVEPSP